MKHFAGLDVGLEETAICIVDGGGRIVRELRACSEPEALVRALQALDVSYARVGLEGLPVVILAVRRPGGGRAAGRVARGSASWSLRCRCWQPSSTRC